MPSEIACPIWGTPSELLDDYRGRDGVGVDSPRAGGRYFISRSAEVNLRGMDDLTRVKLTHEIVDHNMLASIPEIMTTTVDGVAAIDPTRPQDRAARLLKYLVRESKHLGQTLSDFSVSHIRRVCGFSHRCQ